MSSCRRIVASAFRTSYYVPVLGALFRLGWDLVVGTSAIDITLRDAPPRRRRALRNIIKELERKAKSEW